MKTYFLKLNYFSKVNHLDFIMFTGENVYPWVCWQAWVQYNIFQAPPAICRHIVSAILRAPRPTTFSRVPAIFVSTMENHRGWDFVFIATCSDDSSNVNNLIFATFFVKYLNISCYFDTFHPLNTQRTLNQIYLNF